MELILASGSPRRKELLSTLKYPFKIIESDIEENLDRTLPPEIYTTTLAKQKALSVYNKHKNIVIGADTVVYFNNEYLLKPKNKQDAINTLTKLNNNVHKVVTGYAIAYNDKVICGYEETLVTFNNLSKSQIEKYVDSGLPFGKAGSYGIQDGYNLVKEIKGSYDNVVGLPTQKIKELLTEIYSE